MGGGSSNGGSNNDYNNEMPENEPVQPSPPRTNNRRPNPQREQWDDGATSNSNTEITNTKWPNYTRNRTTVYSEMNSILRQRVRKITNGLRDERLDTSDASTVLSSEGLASGKLLLTTTETFSSWNDAKSVCEAKQRSLCSLPQLINVAEQQGSDENTWGWYDSKGNAAVLETCFEGQVKFAGYNCFAGKVAFARIMRETRLPALCCSTLNGAKMTPRKYSMHRRAKSACNQMAIIFAASLR